MKDPYGGKLYNTQLILGIHGVPFCPRLQRQAGRVGGLAMTSKFDGQKVFFTVFGGTYDNRILDAGRKAMTWRGFKGLITSGHLSAYQKDQAPLFSPSWFLTPRDPGCVFAHYTESEEKRGLGQSGEAKRDAHGEPFAWRGAANVIAWSMLPVDIDGQQSMADAKTFFQDYEYVAYTSFNHLKDGDAEKFRLLLLLQEPISQEELLERRAKLLAWMGKVDKTCLDAARGFYMPCCHPSRMNHAQRWHNPGSQCLDALAFEPQELVTLPDSGPTRPQFFLPPSPLAEDERSALLELLQGTYLGNYGDWWKVSSAMVNAGYSLEEFKSITVNGMMRQKNSLDCEKQWRKSVARHQRGLSISPGYLYNIVGGHAAINQLKLDRLKHEIKQLTKLLEE
jgi:hypothetical protein